MTGVLIRRKFGHRDSHEEKKDDIKRCKEKTAKATNS